MINIILQIGTNNSKIGYAAQSRPRITTQSLLIDLQHHKNYSLEEDELFMHRQPRQLAYNFDFSRKDAVLHDIFDKNWQIEDKQLGLTNCKIKSENYCKFIGQLLAEVKQGNNSECSVLLLESPNMKKHQVNQIRQTICQYLFNQANANSVYFLKSSVANVLAQGSPNGIVIDSGQNYTSIARIHDSYQQSVVSLNFGGNFISLQIQKFFINNGLSSSLTSQNQGYLFNKLVRLRQFKDIKQKLSRQDGQIQNERVVQVELPDKQKIIIDKQLIVDPLTRVNEFKQKNDFYLPSNYRGVGHLVVQMLEDSKQKYRESLSKYITFAGGNYLYKDLLDRTESSIIKSAAVRGINDVEFIQNNHKLFSSWIGGSIVASLSSFSNYWVSNKDWRENGASIISKKCP